MTHRMASLGVALSILLSQLTWASASGVDLKSNPVIELPFGTVSPLTGGLAISADGKMAAHIGSEEDIILWDPNQFKQKGVIPSSGAHPTAIALSPDGQRIAIGYKDARLIVRSVVDRKSRIELYGHSGPITALAFSPDGLRLASGGADETTQLWEIDAKKRLQVFDSTITYNGSGSGVPISIGFSGNGKVLLVNEWNQGQYESYRVTTLWDTEEGIEISTRSVAPPNTDSRMRSGQALGGQGWILAYTGGWLNEKHGLMVERLDQCAPPHQLPSGGYADTVTADPLGRWVAVTEDEGVRFFGVSGKGVGHAVALPEKVVTFTPHPDGRSVFVILGAPLLDSDGRLYRIFVPTPLLKLPQIAIQEGAVHCPPLEASRVQQSFKIPEEIPKLEKIADLAPPKQMTEGLDPWGGKKINKSHPSELYFNQTGNLFALYNGSYSSEDFSKSGVIEWDPLTQMPLRARFDLHVDHQLLLRVQDGWLEAKDQLIHRLTGKPFAKLSNQDDKNIYLSASVITDPETGDVFRSRKGFIESYASNGKRRKDIPMKGEPVAMTARNGRLAVLFLSGNVQVWNNGAGSPKTYKMGITFGDGVSVDNLALSADGQYLRMAFPNASGDGPTEYNNYRLSSAKSIGDGNWLTPTPARSNRGVVSDTRTHRLAVWDYDKGSIIARLPRHRSRGLYGSAYPLKVAMTEDGRLLASASYDGLVRVWDIDEHRLVGEAVGGGEVTSIAFDASSQQLAVGKKDGQILIFKVPAR